MESSLWKEMEEEEAKERLSDAWGSISGLRKEIEADVERKFRERYASLKETYESRLFNLTQRLEQVSLVIETDPVSHAMRHDSASAPFAHVRSQELAAEALAEEKEEQIMQLADELSVKTAQVAGLEHELSRAESRNKQLMRKIQTLTQEKELQARELAQVTERADVLKSDLQQSLENKDTELSSLRDALRRLLDTMSSILSDGRGGSMLPHDLEGQVESRLALLVRLQESDKEKKRLLKEQETKLQKLEKLESKYAESVRIAKETHNELVRSKAALERSEEERLELREQYIAIGTKLERIMISQDDQAKREINNLRARLEDAETRAESSKSASERYRVELNSAQMKVERMESKIADLESRLQHTERSHAEKQASSEFTHQQALDGERAKLKHLQERFDEYRSEQTAKLQEAQAEAKNAYEYMQKGREKWEREKEHQLKEYQLKLENQFQKLLDAKQKELESALKARDSILREKGRGVDQVEKKVEQHLQPLLRDHILLSQHREILESQISQLREQGTRVAGEWKSIAADEQRKAVQDAESRLQALFQVQVDSLKDQNAELKSKLEEAFAEKENLRVAMADGKRSSVSVLRQLEESTRKENAFKQQLQVALESISKLKALLQQERQQHLAERGALETKMQAEQVQWEKRLDTLESQCKQQKNQLDTTQQDLQREKAEYETSLRNLSAELEAERMRSKEDKQALTAHAKELENKLLSEHQQALDNQRVLLEKELQVERSQIESVSRLDQARITNLEQLLADKDTELQALRQEKREHEQKRVDLVRNAAQTNEQLNLSTAKVEALQKQLVQQQGTNRALRSRLRKMHSSYVLVFNQVRQLRSMLRTFRTTSQRELSSVATSLLEMSQKIAHGAYAHNDREKLKGAKAVRELESQLVSLKDENKELSRMLESVTQESQQKVLREKSVQEELHVTSLSHKELLSSHQAIQDELVSTREALRHANEKAAKLEHAESNLASTLVEARDKSAMLEKQLESKESQFLSLLTTFRSFVPFSQSVLDDIVRSDKFATRGIVVFQDAIEQALEGRDAAVSKRVAEPLKREAQELRAQMSSVQERLEHSKQQVVLLEGERERLKQSLSELSNERAVLCRKVEDAARLEEEARKYRQEAERRVSELEAEKHALQTSYTSKLESTQAAWRNKLDREKMRTRQIREELLSSASTSEPRRERVMSPSRFSVRTSDSRSSSVRMDDQVDSLLRRSARLDEATQSLLTNSSNTNSTKWSICLSRKS